MINNHKDTNLIAKQKLRKTLFALCLLVIAMFGFGYSLVPLYNVICKVTGLNGKTGGPTALSSASTVDESRTITIEFIANNNANLPWKFYPLVKKITLHPGENKRIAFYAENDANHDMTVQAIPSVTPGEAANYLKKTECFCFTQQTLKSGEGLDMPVVFHIDSALPKKIKLITLSYTLFDTAGVRVKKNDNAGTLK